jgi:aminopeptidase N
VFAVGWQQRRARRLVQRLRRTVIGDLGAWGDEAIIAEARRRFAEFVDRNDTARCRRWCLPIVARYADAATLRAPRGCQVGAQ